jgi:hypothetical protein
MRPASHAPCQPTQGPSAISADFESLHEEVPSPEGWRCGSQALARSAGGAAGGTATVGAAAAGAAAFGGLRSRGRAGAAASASAAWAGADAGSATRGAAGSSANASLRSSRQRLPAARLAPMPRCSHIPLVAVACGAHRRPARRAQGRCRRRQARGCRRCAGLPGWPPPCQHPAVCNPPRARRPRHSPAAPRHCSGGGAGIAGFVTPIHLAGGAATSQPAPPGVMPAFAAGAPGAALAAHGTHMLPPYAVASGGAGAGGAAAHACDGAPSAGSRLRGGAAKAAAAPEGMGETDPAGIGAEPAPPVNRALRPAAAHRPRHNRGAAPGGAAAAAAPAQEAASALLDV